MPEIKNTFLQGKMNKDLDERLVPSGEYRDAMNVEISTSEGSDVGTVKSVLGNKRVEDIVDPRFKCVGSIANEKNNKVYWFISSYEVDAIIEYDVEFDEALPVLVDAKASLPSAVLKFTGSIITGINIIDDLLFWTDNQGEPKKININECKKGTAVDALQDSNNIKHTQLKFDNGSFYGITLDNVNTNANGVGWNEAGSHAGSGQYFWWQTNQMKKIIPEGEGPWPGGDGNTTYDIRHYRNGEYLGLKQIQLIFSTDLNAAYPHGSHAKISGFNHAHPDHLRDWFQGDVLFANNFTVDIEERHITVIKPKPLNAPSIKINHEQTATSTSSIPNLFETKFPRFSYRYKYRDGEFSPMAPFTQPVFNPKYSKNTNSTSKNTLITKDTAYGIKDPYNKAMVNSIHSVELTDFISNATPEDVSEVDILYKQEGSSVVYSIGTIKHVDPEWHMPSNNEGYNLGVGNDTGSTGWDGIGYYAEGGMLKGKYMVTTENIYAALPANQLLRPWDNVPRKALSQEVTGNRIVYGNYLQNYNLGPTKPTVTVEYKDRDNKIGSFSSQGLPSIKSQRNYQLGVVYTDKYGRETPVFTSNQGAINIPWADTNGLKNASRSLQLNVGVSATFPEWVDSLKFFIKENSQEYYNLVMDRAWVTQKTYEIDNSEGHLWISFPSSDRNKIQENDYITLKKKIGTGEEQVSFENKFKVIDIKNEAPDAIKYELVNYGWVSNENDFFNDLFPEGHRRIDRETDTIKMDITRWKERGDSTGLTSMDGIGETLDQQPLHTEDGESASIKLDNLYISWRLVDLDGAGACSKKYKIKTGTKQGGDYFLKLSSKISKEDADLAHKDGVTDNTVDSNRNFRDNLVFQVERKEEKDSEEFSGKFFVKISENQITKAITSGEQSEDIETYTTSAMQPANHLQDKARATGTVTLDSNNYGILNHNGFDAGYGTGTRSIRGNINIGEGRPGGSTPGNAFVTDWETPWSQALGFYSNQGLFFIDSMYMTAGQSQASNYAKYCCVTWAGCTKNQVETPEESSWAYPPLKTWWTDFESSAEMLEQTSQPLTGFGFGLGAVSGAALAVLNSYGGTGSGTWFNGQLISENHILPENADWNNFRIDGWVGPLQNVDRADIPVNFRANNHVNGLEGIVTTTSDHTTGPRRWLSGITNNSTNYGVGVDTKTYGEEAGRHFIHISYFAPGENLHNDNWDIKPGQTNSNDRLFGVDSISGKLQGIWGGGHFTGVDPSEAFGVDPAISKKFRHVCMETNNEGTAPFKPLKEAPGPGVGQGYDTDYQELHDRQWDPTFGVGNEDPTGAKRKFINNLVPGSKFKFANDQSPNDPTIYTIKNVTTKKLYNHTSWRRPYNIFSDTTDRYFSDTLNQAYHSVEEAGLAWLNTLDENGENATSSARDFFRKKIVDFGKRHNRRICYIVEIDKSPETPGNHNPLLVDGIPDAEEMNANISGNIEFLEEVQSVLLSDLNKFPAIWETDPKKSDVDLDIYYEASNNIPIKINNRTNELFAPIGCKVEVLDSSVSYSSNLLYWEDNKAILYPGFPAASGAGEIDYTNVSFKFTKEDGGFVIVKAGENPLTGVISGFKTDFIFKRVIDKNLRVGLSWHNCYSFGNGIESNRIRDDFNEVFLTNGVKASTVTQQTYEEERRSHGLIYSGLYNSNSGINDLNQFIMAEKITKDLNPTYGSIQKLFQRRISLIAFCEDRVVSITSNKDAIYNADGNPQLISSNRVLGDANPFVGNYGISKNPESFASESYRAYFADKQRGAVLRLSKDGLTPISKAGMHDYFRDNLPKYSALIGSYDSYKENYNITLSKGYGENIIYNTRLEEGLELSDVEGGTLNAVVNGGIFAGGWFQYPWEVTNVLTSQEFMIKQGANNTSFLNPNLTGTVNVINHEAIPKGSIQEYVPQENAVMGETVTTAEEFFQPAGFHTTGDTPDTFFKTGVGVMMAGNYTGAVNGTNNIFGDQYAHNGGYNKTTIRRWADGTAYHSNANQSRNFHIYGGLAYVYINMFGWSDGYCYNSIQKSATVGSTSFSGIVFDRVKDPTPSNTFVVFKDFVEQDGNPQETYNNNNPTATGINGEKQIFNGEEIRVRVKIKVLATYRGLFTPTNSNGDTLGGRVASSGNNSVDSNGLKYGWNHIEPYIQLLDGGTAIPQDKLVFRYGNPNYLTSWGNIDLSDGSGGITTYGLVSGGFQTGNAQMPNTLQNFTNQNWGSLRMFDFGSNFNQNYSLIQAFNSAPSTNWAIDPSFTTNENEGLTQNEWGVNSDGSEKSKFYCIKYEQTSSLVNFPVTVNPHVTNGSYDQHYTTYVLEARFKFKDPAQQSSGLNGLSDSFQNAMLSGDTGNVGAAPGITDVVVVNDLQIKIGQDRPSLAQPGVSDYWSYGMNASYYPNSRYPFWAIESVQVDKVSRVITPSVASVDQVSDTWLLKREIKEVLPVPPEHVPAWTQISHQGLDGWSRAAAYSNNMGYYQLATGGSANGGSGYGSNYSAVQQTGLAQNEDASTTGGWNNNGLAYNGDQLFDTHLDGGTISYVVPQDWVGLATPGSSPAAGTPFRHEIIDENGYIIGGNNRSDDASTNFTSKANNSGLAISGNNFDRVSLGKIPNNASATPAVVQEPNNYYYYAHGTAQSGATLTYDISTQPWIDGKWYLIDIEYHNDAFPNAFSGGANGLVEIVGAVDITVANASGDYGQPYSNYVPGSVGVVSGGLTNRKIASVKVLRKEYGSEEYVRRIIFKYVQTGANNPNECRLNFYNVINGTAFKKIIIKRMDRASVITAGSSSNALTSWLPAYNQILHCFDTKQLYYNNNSLCWNTRPGQASWYLQGFNRVNDVNFAIDTMPAPKFSPLGWKLKFTIGDNPDTGTFSGGVRVYVNNAIGDSNVANAYDGMFVGDSGEGIMHKGDYEVFFNMLGSSQGENFDLPDGTNVNWYIKRSTNNGATWSNYTGLSGNFVATTGSNTSLDDKIVFTGPASGTGLTASVKNISLTDATKVFEGGNANGWSFRGFDPAINDYIYWGDEDGNNDFDGRLYFKNMPYVLDGTSAVKTPITAGQLIDKTIKKGEKYLIEFDYYVENAHLNIYYYNSAGEGFGIADNFLYNLASSNPDGVTGTYSKIHEIGEAKWTNVNPSGNEYTSRLKNTFVIIKGSGANLMNGWIDNIKMTRYFDDSELKETTVTFSEDVNGWTSFKSFIPENSVSVSKKYFTLYQGGLWQHYVPMVNGASQYVDENNNVIKYTPEEANNYNEFYNYQGPEKNSTITTVLNADPSVVKTFNTLNYEGSQSHVPVPAEEALVQIHNALEYSNNQETLGWYCEDISTNLASGTINEFIKKEDKWFNYIKGKLSVIVDASRFSTQGIGTITTATAVDPGELPSVFNTQTNVSTSNTSVTVSTGNTGGTGGTGGAGGGGGGTGGGGY